MGRESRAKYRRWRRREEEARRNRQMWRVASLCLIVLAAFAAWVFYDRVVSGTPAVPPPPPEPRPVTLMQPAPEATPPASVQEQASSGEERPELPKTRAKTRRVATDRTWRHEQANVAPPEVEARAPVPNPGPVTVAAPPAPAPPAPPVPASVSRPMPKPKPKVVRVTQEKQKKKKKKRRVIGQQPAAKKPVVITVPPRRPGPPNTSTLHEVEATPIDD